MPGLLNSCWLLLAICAAVHWLCSNAQCHAAGKLRRALALSCVLALLFPVISADDDRLQQQLASDANGFFKVLQGSSNPHKFKVRLAPALAVASVTPMLIITVHDTADFVAPVYRTLKSQTTGDRSPPQI